MFQCIGTNCDGWQKSIPQYSEVHSTSADMYHIMVTHNPGHNMYWRFPPCSIPVDLGECLDVHSGWPNDGIEANGRGTAC